LPSPYGGVIDIEFDWLEEGACCDACPTVYDGVLSWSCDCCSDQGSADLIECKEEEEAGE